MWLSVDIVVKMCRDVELLDFKQYMKLGSGKIPSERGFFLHEIERKLHSIFIFDRPVAKNMLAKGHPLNEAPSIRHWIEFLDIFTANFERNSEEFYRMVFAPRCSRLHVPYTLTSSHFGIESSRITLRQRLNALRAEGLLPTVHPPHEAPLDVSSPQPSSRETRAARRGSNQFSPSDLQSSDSDTEELSKHVLEVIERVDLLSKISNEGCIIMTAIEEWIIGTAMCMRSLKESYANKNPRAFEIDLTTALKKNLSLLGADFPAVLQADSRNVSTESPCPRPHKLLLQSDLSDMFARYHPTSVGRLSTIHRTRRLSKVQSLKAAFYKSQFFSPPFEKSLLDYFAYRARYGSNSYMLVANNSLIARTLHQKHDDDNDSSDENDIEESRSQRRRSSLEAAAGAIRAKNREQTPDEGL